MYIAYIYDKTNTVIAQVEEILDFECTKKINAVSTWSFGLYHTNPYCKREFLKKYVRVKVNIINGNIEKTIFDWVIRGFGADIDKTSVKLASFDHYFERRLLHQTYNFTNQSVDTILSTILWDINTRHQSNISLDCWVATLTSKTYNKWETFFKVLQDLSGNGFEFYIENMTLVFKETIGIDRTSWPNFLQYRYDVNEPDDRSIDDVSMDEDGKEFTNWVIGKSWSNFTEIYDPTSIAEFWLIENSFTNSWDDASWSSKYLADHKDIVSEFSIDAVSRDFFEADLWDMVSVYIFVWNDIMFFDGSMKIIEKRYTAWDLPKIQFWLSTWTVKSKDVLDQIIDIQERVKTLEFK